jgi:hypothetical protein
MASTTTSLINNTFAGIRRKNSSFSSECISCSDCQNVELYFTKLNSGIGIRTAKGNIAVSKNELESIVPQDENIIGIFESFMDNDTYFFVYTENQTEGKLYTFNITTVQLDLLISGLEATGRACGESFTQGWLDMFIFSNGENVKYLYCDTETHAGLTIEEDAKIKLVDQDNRTVKGLGLKVFDSRLWIFDGKVLWYSQKEDCRVFNFVDPDKVTSSGYIEFVKPITAIYPYLGSLAVFHKDSSVLVTLDATTMFKQEDESPGGCASYDSLVFHGTDLYFYDDTKKGVFSFKQIINGDKTLGENIALDVQDELMEINAIDLYKIRALSVVTFDRNEVWFLVPISQEENRSIVLIYDYIRGEWVKRKCQTINCLGLFNSRLYSAGKDIYEEYVTERFDGEFIDAYYTCSIFNLGEDNTLKITKFPPRIICDGSYKNHFWVEYVKNYNPLKSPKIKEVIGKTYGGVMVWDSGDCWDSGAIYQPNNFNATLKLPSATFKALEVKLYTTNTDENFCIKSIEYSRIKVKQV